MEDEMRMLEADDVGNPTPSVSVSTHLSSLLLSSASLGYDVAGFLAIT